MILAASLCVMFFVPGRIFSILLNLIAVVGCSDHEKDLEIWLLRQQLRILQGVVGACCVLFSNLVTKVFCTFVTAAARLETIPGVGVLTAAWLLVTTLNFTSCATPDEATAYAGLAPHPYQSGTSVRGRPAIGHTGNGRLRKALYLATLSAAQYNPVIKEFYDRLRAAGKPPKVARCAAARKLLHIAWAVATKGQSFDPRFRCQRSDSRV